jgi:hypothetical protein
VLVRIGRDCETEIVAQPIRALEYVVGPGEHVFARSLGANDLVELADGLPTGTRWVLQSADYTPIAITASDDVVHLDRAVRWQVLTIRDDGTSRDVLGGTGFGRFALAPDGTTVAHVDGVYQIGAVRLRDLHGDTAPSEALAVDASRVAWSPDGRRLAILLHDRSSGYSVAVWDRERRALSASRPVAIRYDSEMTWIDERRIAFGMPHEYLDFSWIDPDTGESGSLAFVDKQQFSLAPAHADRRLAFVTETATEIVPWIVEAGVARRLAAVTVTSPRSSRLPRVAWSADDSSLLVYDGASGELWSAAVDGGAATRMPDLPMPRAGGSGELVLAVTAHGLVVFALAHSADVYTSEPLD